MISSHHGTDPNLQRCSRHGIYFNARRYAGCAVCRTGRREVEADAARLPILRFTVLGTVVVGLSFGAGKGMRALADGGERAVARSVEESLLDPATFRPQIEALETLVYDASLVGYEHAGRIFRAASDLSDELGLDSGSPTRRRIAQEVLLFGQELAASGDVGYATVDVSAAQQEWEAIRAKIFREAEWFRRAAPVSSDAENAGPTM